MGLVQGVGAKGAKKGQIGAIMKKIIYRQNKCLICGSIIPEGRSVCASCKDSSCRVLHDIKIYKDFYLSILDNAKLFEVREDDRNYQVGDLIHFNPVLSSGVVLEDFDNLIFEIIYLLKGGQFGIEPGYVVFSIRKSDKFYYDSKTKSAVFTGANLYEDRK